MNLQTVLVILSTIDRIHSHDDHQEHTKSSIDGFCHKLCNNQTCSTTCPDETTQTAKYHNSSECQHQCDHLQDSSKKNLCDKDCGLKMPKMAFTNNAKSLVLSLGVAGAFLFI